MSVSFALVCAALLYAFLALIGRAALISCGQSSLPLVEQRAIAPVIGLAILTLLTTYLVLSGTPLVKVAVPVAIALALLSVLLLLSNRRPGVNVEEDSPWYRGYLLPFVVTALLLALPFALGGFEFAILRGNGTDAFNYVTMADAFTRYPLDWVMSQPKDVLASYSPSLPLAQELLKTRWSTSALLAFVSAMFGIAPIEFEYTFTLTLMLALYSALVACLSATAALTKLTVWLAVAFVAGFWGQFTLDIRAFSQITALPLVAMILAWLLSQSITSTNLFRYGVLPTAVLFAALIFQYPEIVLAYLPGAGLIFIARIWVASREKNSSPPVLGVAMGFAALALALSAPLIRFVFSFAYDQAQFAANKSMGWENAYFSWMKNPVSGLWGGGSKLGLGNPLDTLFLVLGFVVGALLTLGVLMRLRKVIGNLRHWQENYAEAAIFLLAASAAAGATLLFVKGNPWSAGKVISFFALLIPILLAGWLHHGVAFEARAQTALATRAIRLAILGWLVLGALFAGARLIHAAKETDFGRYIGGHGEHRRVGAGAMSKIQNQGCPPQSRVAVFDSSIWAREFRTHFAEGNGFQVVSPPYSTIRNNSIDPNRATNSNFDCVLANGNYFVSSAMPHAQSSTEVLASIKGEDFAALVDIEGGYGVELDRATARRFVFTGNQEVTLKVLGRAEQFTVLMKVCPGISRKPEEALTIFVDVDGVRTEEFQLAECAEKAIHVTGSRTGFVKTVRLRSADSRHEPSLIGADPRDLRVRVEVVGINLKGSHE
jgi:hypothetical protein